MRPHTHTPDYYSIYDPFLTCCMMLYLLFRVPLFVCVSSVCIFIVFYWIEVCTLPYLSFSALH